MTPAPCSIGADQALACAHGLLREHSIRHLPVLDGGKLVGMLTDRDLGLVESLRDVDPQVVKVEDAMSTNLYSVAPDALLGDVVREVAARKLGSAVVMQNNKVVGIFTTVDVCRAFGELLETRLAR
jgi:acetoin utilization protein AcuB